MRNYIIISHAFFVVVVVVAVVVFILNFFKLCMGLCRSKFGYAGCLGYTVMNTSKRVLKQIRTENEDYTYLLRYGWTRTDDGWTCRGEKHQ